MSADRGRRIAAIVLLVLVLISPLAVLLPGSPAAVRVADIPLLWWYALLVGPLAAAAAATVALLRSPR